MSRSTPRPTPRDPRISKRIGVLVIASLPVAALLGIVVLKLLLMMLFSQISISQAAAGDYKSALATARWNLIANVVEPWRAHYNVGTAELGLELYDDARGSLSYSLQSAPLPDGCYVRTNLALAIEGQGDRASDNDEFDVAIDFYAQAVAMLENMPAECKSEAEAESQSESDEESESASESDGESDGGGTLGEQSEQSEARLGEKGEQAESDLEQQEQQQQQQQEQQETDSAPDGQGEESAGSPLDDLGDRMDAAEQDRTDWDSVDRSQNAPFELPDKPW